MLVVFKCLLNVSKRGFQKCVWIYIVNQMLINKCFIFFSAITDCGFGMQKYLVRLLAYLPGTTIAKITSSPQILYDVGKMAATLDTVLLQVKYFIPLHSIVKGKLLSHYLHIKLFRCFS